MSCIGGRFLLQTCRRTISFNPVRGSKTVADPLDHATGNEKRELLAETSANDDPFLLKTMKRSHLSTKESPNLIPSVFDCRAIGCVCEDDATSVNWMWLHAGPPRRCECGHWFKLIEHNPQ